MDIELLTIGLNSAATALVVGCIALIRLTVKNFHAADSTSSPSKFPKISYGKQHAPDVGRPGYSFELSAELLKSVAGDTNLLKELSLPIELSPSLLVDGDNLSSAAANTGFSNLEVVARALMAHHPDEKPYFFGINRGGGLLANLLSQRLKLDQKYLVRCDYKPKWKRVLCEPRAGINFAIIVDDAVRSGETIDAVKRKLKEIYPEASVYVMALVVSGTSASEVFDKDQRLFGLVDYYPWISLGSKTALPWSDEESDDASDYLDEEGINQLVGRLISHGESEHSKEFLLPSSGKEHDKTDA